MPPEDTPGVVAATDEAVVHHHSPPSSVITGQSDHKRKRTKHSVNDDAPLPQELTAARSMIDGSDADRGATEPAAGGAHRSQRRAPAPERTHAGGSSNKDDKALSPSLAPPPASTQTIRVKHSSSSFVIGGGGGKQHPYNGSDRSPGSGSHSYYANNHHAAAAPSSSKRLIFLGPRPTAPQLPPPPHHLPANARRPRSASTAPSAAVPLEPNDDELFRQGVEVFGEWDAATQQAEVNRFVRQQSPEGGGGFSFWLTPKEAGEDLEFVHKKVEEARLARITSKAASGSGGGKPRRH